MWELELEGKDHVRSLQAHSQLALWSGSAVLKELSQSSPICHTCGITESSQTGFLYDEDKAEDEPKESI